LLLILPIYLHNSARRLLCQLNVHSCRSQWPRRRRRSSAAARLLRLSFESHWGHGCLSWVLCVR